MRLKKSKTCFIKHSEKLTSHSLVGIGGDGEENSGIDSNFDQKIQTFFSKISSDKHNDELENNGTLLTYFGPTEELRLIFNAPTYQSLSYSISRTPPSS